MNQASLLAAPLLAVLLTSTAAIAEDGDTLKATPYADIRYRLELVDQDGLPEDATASTLRVKGGVRTSEWNGLSALVEGEAILRVGPADYNDTVNGRSAYPVVADPSDALLNQALVKWRGLGGVSLTAGRQVVNLDNQRWVGSVGWRQNDQTLDAVRASIEPAPGTSIEYLHAWRVNRVFGPDSPQGIWHDNDIHAVRGAFGISPLGTVSIYGYFLDIPDAPQASSQTLGVRLTGKQSLGSNASLLYSAEYARQRDHGANPQDFALDYLLAEPGLALGDLTLKAGYERLEGDGSAALQTPLATLHAFNGWADKFLTTPADGLRDLYLDAAYKFSGGSAVKGLSLRLVYHDFNSTRAGYDYGTEWNAMAGYPVSKRITLLAKFARYEASSFATDTTKTWLSLEAKF